MSATRNNDVVIRMGGDEFIIILETSDVNVMEEVIKRIKCFTNIGFSCGYEIYDQKLSFEENLEAVDARLYEAKKEKR